MTIDVLVMQLLMLHLRQQQQNTLKHWRPCCFLRSHKRVSSGVRARRDTENYEWIDKIYESPDVNSAVLRFDDESTQRPKTSRAEIAFVGP